MLLQSIVLTALTSAAFSVPSSDGADWPQWRGPARTGVSEEASWSAVGKPEALWTRQLGLGHSSFAVANGRVFTLGYDEGQSLDTVYCLDATSGEVVWSHSYSADIWNIAHDGGALTTPAVVGDLVYTSNREAKAFCFDAATGEVRWTRDLRADLELEPPTWGYSASPLVVGDHVFLNMDRVIALDRQTGETAWTTENSYGITYSTPTPFERDGKDYLAVLSGAGLAVLERANGAELDLYEWVKEPQIYPMSPVVIGDRIFISAGYDRGCAMLSFDGSSLTELWASRVMRNKMSGCVLWQDHLFGFDESILKCIDLDGKERWRERGMGTGSMMIAGGRLVILDGRGEIIVAEANPEAYVELSRQDVLSDGTAWSTPVLSHGRVYCRSSLGEMACLDFTADTKPMAAAAGSSEATMDLPAAQTILARHRDAVHGEMALGKVRAVRMRGQSDSLINTVRKGGIEFVWDAAQGFAWNDDSGLMFGHNRELGWRLQPRSAPSVLRGSELEAVREIGDLTRVFDPSLGYRGLETTSMTTFEGRSCYAVAAKTEAGDERTLYFEVDSGLYAGHEGQDIAMWTLDAYREFEGVLLPTRWSTYEPDKGEHATAVFDEVELNPEALEGKFDVPEPVRPFARSKDEVERDTLRLTELHAKLIGTWRSETEAEAEPSDLVVRDGFLVFERGDREPLFLTEPDESGSMTAVGLDYLMFTPETADDGSVTAVQILVAGQPRDRLVRAE